MSRRIRRGFDPGRFREVIGRSGIRQDDLARLAEVDVSTLWRWGKGGGSPDVEALARVAAVLQVPITELVDVPDDEAMPADLRIRRGLTQVDLAARAGLSTTAVSGFERGQSRWSLAKAEPLAAALGVSVEQLQQAWRRARTRPPGTSA